MWPTLIYLALVTFIIALPLYAHIQQILSVGDVLKVTAVCAVPILGQLYVLLMLLLIITDAVDFSAMLDYTIWKGKG